MAPPASPCGTARFGSTLLALVSAFAGLDFVRDAYRLAVENRYRFFSYGDAMLIL